MTLLGQHLSVATQTGRGLNERIHWAERARRSAKEREAGRWAALFALPPRDWPVARLQQPGRYVVQLTRISAGTLDDDNLAGALKAYRDGVADRLGVNDGDVARVRWQYAQQRGRRGQHGVRLAIHLEALSQSAIHPQHGGSNGTTEDV